MNQQHYDNRAIDVFAQAMKENLAKQRENGYAGWQDEEKCPTEWLQAMLRNNIEKGDPIDVGTVAMMLWARGDATANIEMKKGKKYKWKHSDEILVFIGKNFSGNGYWYQFALADNPHKVWCEVVGTDLCHFEAVVESPKIVCKEKLKPGGC